MSRFTVVSAFDRLAAWIEEPGYLDVRGALVAAGARLVPVPVDAEGLNVEAGRALAPDARLAYVSPSHQYPTGATLSPARRAALLAWAGAAGAWIVEDDYDSYFRYRGRPLPALQRLDADTGAARGAVADRNSPLADQAALAAFIADGHYDRQLRRARTTYAERYQALRHHAARRLGGVLALEPAAAGTHVLASLAASRAHPDAAARVSRAAAAEGMVVFPLSRYCLTTPAEDKLVLGYGGLTPELIGEGVERLAGCIERSGLPSS
ncbi:MAG TPA: hypothetical protein VKA84_01170 [Gemmatimonadaceae bacterium]|nr:hypothetical protein [Gemmatimonadaceae bacterium]